MWTQIYILVFTYLLACMHYGNVMKNLFIQNTGPNLMIFNKMGIIS